MSDVLIAFKTLPPRYGRCRGAIEKWLRDENMGFPRPVFVRGKRFFRSSELEAFEARFADRFGARIEAA